VEESNGDPTVSCGIDLSFPALLHFAYKYSDSAEKALLASANAGGENVARNAALGAIFGAAYGFEAGFTKWMKDGLLAKDEIDQEIKLFVNTLPLEEIIN